MLLQCHKLAELTKHAGDGAPEINMFVTVTT